MTTNEFREMALEIPTPVERSHINHPGFRVAGKIFASLGVPDEGWGMVRLTPEQQNVLVKKAPGIFKLCSGAWGRRATQMFILRRQKRAIVRTALDAAAKNARRHQQQKKMKTPNVQRSTPNYSDKGHSAAVIDRQPL
jgi:hypothetical protein